MELKLPAQSTGNSRLKYAVALTRMGTVIDIHVRLSCGEQWYVECKVDKSARECIRRAIGQLLEYSLYGESDLPKRMMIAGNCVPNSNDHTYLSRLSSSYGLNFEYRTAHSPCPHQSPNVIQHITKM